MKRLWLIGMACVFALPAQAQHIRNVPCSVALFEYNDLERNPLFWATTSQNIRIPMQEAGIRSLDQFEVESYAGQALKFCMHGETSYFEALRHAVLGDHWERRADVPDPMHMPSRNIPNEPRPSQVHREIGSLMPGPNGRDPVKQTDFNSSLALRLAQRHQEDVAAEQRAVAERLAIQRQGAAQAAHATAP